MSDAALELEGVSVEFESVQMIRALDDLSLRISPGEAVAVIGPSGSGKTTLLRTLAGWQRPGRGRVSIGGRDLAELSRRDLRALRAEIGFVHQDLRLVPNLRVIKNVIAGGLGRSGLAASLRSMLWPSEDERLRAHAVLEAVEIEDRLYERSDRLSGGEQQRVAIARALYQSPSVLLADEPVASVDPTLARQGIELLLGLARDRGAALCVSLHDVELARACFPRLVGLRDGRLVFDGPATQVDAAALTGLYASPRNGLRDVP